MFADAADGEDGAAFKAFGLAGRRIFERFAVGTEPDLGDALAADAVVDAAGDGLDLGELGHESILGTRDRRPGSG